MKGHTQLGLSISVREIERFGEFVYGTYRFEPSTNRYRDLEIAKAILAYMDQDLGAVVESRLDAHEEALGDSLPGYSRRRRSSDDPLVAEDLNRGETDRIRPYIPTPIYTDLKEYVDGLDVDMTYSEAIERAMREHRDGGRERRLADRLEDMTATVESADINISAGVESDDGADESESTNKPYSREEKLEAIREDVLEKVPESSFEELDGAGLPKVWFHEAIDRWCPKGDREQASDRTHDTYIRLLCEEYDLTEQPETNNLVVGDPGGLAFERTSYDALTTEERVEAVRVKLLQRADSGRGAQVSAADIQAEFFDGEPSDSVAHDLRNRAAEADGFAVRKARDGVMKVRVNVSEVTDTNLLEAAGVADRRKAEAEATAEMDALMNAQVVTDGGRSE